MITDIDGVIDPVVQSLRALAEHSPDLEDIVRLYETILPLIRDADIYAAPVSVTPEQAHSKMEMGLPLLHNLDLEVDLQEVCDLMLRLASSLEKIGETKWPHAPEAQRIRLALQQDKLNVNYLLPAVAAGEKRAAISTAKSLELDAELLWTLAQNALKPALRAWSSQLNSLVVGIPWVKGYCPICGAGAILGELRGNTQGKHLRCGQCGAGWPFPRLRCLYCGNEDHNTLGYLCSENKKFRVEVCEKCHGYLKVIASFDPMAREMLTVEDLATLHLDYAVRAKGYTRSAVRQEAPNRLI